jgi:uncharacterized repeat protein (TIGR01451 family)
MNGLQGSGGGRLVLSLAALAAVAMPATVPAQTVRVRSYQIPLQEPPVASAIEPAVPGAARQAVDPPSPVVSIRVRVPSTASAGRELEYSFLVENSSSADAHHVRVRASMPAKARYKTARPAPTAVPGTPEAAQPTPKSQSGASEVVWEIGTLKGGQRREIVLVIEPAAGDDLLCCARVSFEHGECVRTRMSKPTLRVRTNGPDRARQYDPLTYVVEVTNAGSADANEVVLTEELPPGLQFSDSNPSTSGTNPLTWKLGTLAPGDKKSVEFKVIPVETGTHPLKATVAAAGIAAESNLSRVLVGEPKLQLVMTGPSWRSLDRPATYFLTISNPSPVPATNLILADDLYSKAELRSFIEFVSASDDGKLTGDNVRWSLGTLGPGSRRTISLTLRSLREGSFRNVATVRGDRGLTANAFASTEFQAPSGLTLNIEKTADPVAVGKTTSFTLRLQEHGGAPSTKVALSVTLPDGLQHVDAKGPSDGKQDGRTVTFLPLGELSAGAEAVFTVTVRAERAGELKLRATVTTDPARAQGKIEREETLLVVPESASTPPPAVPEPVRK